VQAVDAVYLAVLGTQHVDSCALHQLKAQIAILLPKRLLLVSFLRTLFVVSGTYLSCEVGADSMRMHAHASGLVTQSSAGIRLFPG
jgi:hypothetical protein